MTEWSPLGIPQMIVILALLWGALWKQGWLRVVLSLCLLIWGTFAISYDIKVAMPLIGIGIVLFIMGTMKLINQSREDQEEA
jgi:membrane-bound ClpP family serine protease